MGASNDEVPSPGTDDEIFQFTDEDIAEYIEFPEDTIFLESLAHNAKFKKGVAYVPVQRTTGANKQPETHIYIIRPGMTEAEHLIGPIATEDGTQVTVFGSALTSDGILYLCAFNRNSVIDFDLKSIPDSKNGEPVQCNMEIVGIPSPNDICIDPKDESTLYVAGGTFRKPCCMEFTNASYGQVLKVKVNRTKKSCIVTSQAKGFDTLAGIEVVGENLWVAQLYDIITLKKGERKSKLRWKGNDGKGSVWLADNIDLFDDRLILCPAYSTVPEWTVNAIATRNVLVSTAVFYVQIVTACMKRESIEDALRDPEVSLAFSNTYIKDDVPPAPIRIVIMTPDGEAAYHFEIDLVKTRELHEPWEVKDPTTGEVRGKRHYFNEQVTHASHLKTEDGDGYIVCVNFEEPRILLLKDAKFRQAITSTAQVA